ncbi:hypothetical protein ACLOAV_004436 [Pseudogymnoascus australis]
MAELTDLEGLELLHRDLVAQAEQRLPNIDRLWVQLETRLDEFRRLLDKAPRNEQSRKSLDSGRIQIQDEEYSINDDFKQGALMLADAVNLDELDAARIFFASQEDADVLGRSVLECSIIRFHQTRKYLLDCFRLVLQLSSANTDSDADSNSDELEAQENIKSTFQTAVGLVLQTEEKAENGPSFVKKCLQSMADIRTWLQDLADRVNSANVLYQGQTDEFSETIEYQRVSLIQQHESLGSIVHGLVKARYSSVDNFENVLGVLRQTDRFDNLLVHYIPATAAFISMFGSPEGSGSLQQARNLNRMILENKDKNNWTLQYVYAGVSVLWLGEYSGWYLDNQGNSPAVGVNLDDEKRTRSEQFASFLKDGAFEFLLSLGADVKSGDWQDPARQGLRRWLQNKVPPMLQDSVQFSDFFQLALKEQLEAFIDAFITNMPDPLRKLRTEEQEQRQLSLTYEHDLDLERFLVIISYAFEQRPDAALAFWSDPDSNLAGFLQWASCRASTPLLSAFCEMLQAISEDDECATASHRFLLEESTTASGKLRRSQSLTWSQIFTDLTHYTSKLRNQPAPHQSSSYRAGKPGANEVESEPEETLMLESYLRLITRLCAGSEEARTFILKHPTFHLTGLLYELASSRIESRLRACAFTTLRSLLSQKSKEINDITWMSLDQWISGGHSTMPKAPLTMSTSASITSGIFEEISTGFEEPNSFIQFLTALLTPAEPSMGLNDDLPFPENLGSSKRMPGIDAYVDFVVGQIFVRKSRTAEIINQPQQRLLSLTCLDFISTCLNTFNEDLVVFANESNVSVDSAIRASDLDTYVRLHPFSRTMEWMFNEKVMDALFESVHEEISAVGNAAPSSPLVLSILAAIHVITLIMDLQPTYLDIIRPLNRQQATHARPPVANAAYASFDDGVLSHLSVIVDLGLYCGSGHSELAVASLKLLQRFSTSPKLISPPVSNIGGRRDRNKAIAALEMGNDSERIARSLISEFESNIDMEEASESPAYNIKLQILDFVNACLQAMPNRPSIAHLLLGFRCESEILEVLPDSPFARDASLFHSIMKLAIQCPVQTEQNVIAPWLTRLKSKALQVMRTLWKSPISSQVVMVELRSHSFFTHLWTSEVIIGPQTISGLGLPSETYFGVLEPQSDINDFLSQRSMLFQYVASELRRVSKDGSTSVRQHISNTLLGRTTIDDGTEIQNYTIFDMFDFMVVDPAAETFPISPYFNDLNFNVCLTGSSGESHIYDIKRVEALLVLRRSELKAAGYLRTPEDEAIFEVEALNLLRFMTSQSNISRLHATWLETLEGWTQVVLMTVTVGDLEDTNKLRAILEAILVVQSKLERHSSVNIEASQKLATLAKFLLFNIDFTSEPFRNDDVASLANERLGQLFSVSLKAIQSPISDSHFRETLYTICYKYLVGMSDMPRGLTTGRQYITQTIKGSGESLVAIICDDAYAGENTCRISALLLLGQIVELARKEDSSYINTTLSRINFIGLLVDSLQNILDEMQDLRTDEIDMYLSYVNAKLALLVQVSQTRPGATAVLGAGLFQIIRDSGVFSTDPDIGLDIADVDAIKKHYGLLLALMRVINCCVVSRGPQNEQTLAQAKKFVSENRLWMLSVFKRSARIGAAVDNGLDEVVDELSDAYMLLISMSGFLDLNYFLFSTKDLPLHTQAPATAIFTTETFILSAQIPPVPAKRRIADTLGTGVATAASMPDGDKSSARSEAKRQRTIESTIAGHPKGKMPETIGLVAPSNVDFRRAVGFQPQSGVRKLVVKNLRPSRVADLREHYGKVQVQVLDATTAILKDQQPRQPLERLYRDVEDICRNNQAEGLYKELRQRTGDYLESSILGSLQMADNRDDPLQFLGALLDAWKDWNAKAMRIRAIFGFLDRSFLLNSKEYPQLNDMSIQQFRSIILENPAVNGQVYDATNKMINNDRKHGGQDQARWFKSTLLKDIIMMLLITNLYKARFEPKFLDGTKRELLSDAQDVLIRDRSDFLLDVHEVGSLLEARDIESLKSLYGLLKGSEIQDKLKVPWEEYIKKAGATIVSDQGKGDDMVVRLLELKRALDLINRDAFSKDEIFKFSMREAYSTFINDRKSATVWGTGNSKVGEVIAKYIDLLLRGGLKAVPRSLASDELDRMDAEKQGLASTGDEDAELDRQLEQGLELFRFIEGKDVFEAFYKKDLARRLLMARSASQDAERNMLTKLKSECGSNFTHNLEQMFKDQELSRDEMISYKQSLSNTSKTTMDLQVSVLSAAAWPTYPDITINLPVEVARHIEKFDRHYKHKHTGRRLTWKHSLAHSIVKGHFKKGTKELQVSGFQAVVLVLFNDIADDEALSYTALQASTGLVDAELTRTMQSLACGKVRILTKHPKGREVAKTDTFTVNLAFTDPKFRIKINQIQLKETTAENKETHERVALDRQYETQAAIVRIMKSRKVLPHQSLVAEVIEQTKMRGAVEVGEIKKNIEKLIEKDYIERDEGNYTYLA